LRRSRFPEGWRRGPVPMREQEVDGGRVELHQSLVRRQRIIAYVDRAQQPSEEMVVTAVGQSAKGGDDGRVAAAAVPVATVPVVRLRVAVEAHPDTNLQVVEEAQVGVVQ